MKLSITQIVLGVIIILAACYVTGWMIYQAPDLLKIPVPDDGSITYVDAIPADEVLFNISRYGSNFLPVLGIFMIIAGTVQAAKSGGTKRNLVIVNITIGVLTAVISYIITFWGYPTSFIVLTPENTDLLEHIFTNPGRTQTGIESISGVLFLTGLAAVGVSIAQLVKSRKNAMA